MLISIRRIRLAIRLLKNNGNVLRINQPSFSQEVQIILAYDIDGVVVNIKLDKTHFVSCCKNGRSIRDRTGTPVNNGKAF